MLGYLFLGQNNSCLFFERLRRAAVLAFGRPRVRRALLLLLAVGAGAGLVLHGRHLGAVGHPRRPQAGRAPAARRQPRQGLPLLAAGRPPAGGGRGWQRGSLERAGPETVPIWES